VVGVGDQPPHDLPEPARGALAHYEHVPLADDDAVLAALHGLSRQCPFDRVECLWEPYMLLAARIRTSFGLPGMTVAQTLPFRDKERMKRVLDAAGFRTPHHASATTVAGVWEAAARIGYPIIVKPIAGAGSADTYRVDSGAQLAEVLPALRHVPEVSVEEFVDGEELTVDTVCAGGEILFENVMWYRPRPLQNRMHEWISPVSIVLRDLSVPELQGGRRMGAQVLPRSASDRASRTWSGTARRRARRCSARSPPGRPARRVVELMNYACDADLYVGWAEACCTGTLRAPIAQKYNAGSVFKRAHGAGPDHRGRGPRRLLQRYGDDVVLVDLLPVGAPRRDWRTTSSATAGGRPPPRAGQGDRDDRAFAARPAALRGLTVASAFASRTHSPTSPRKWATNRSYSASG
jgi:hypothetical protein